MLNSSFRYHNGTLHADQVPLSDIVQQTGTPVYIYSLKRALENLSRIEQAFGGLKPHIHYSAKANNNPAILRHLVAAGAGIDCVSGGEIFLALKAGCASHDIVFAGVGKTLEDLRYAVEQKVGWVNVENVDELQMLNRLASERGSSVRVALRLNPGVEASTHKHIATGHGGAKFGLSTQTVNAVLAQQADYPCLRFEGIHIHIGSQLGDTAATEQAVRQVLQVIAPYPTVRTVDIGGGLPVAYRPTDRLPDVEAFARTLTPLLHSYDVLLEPGRSIVADAGILVSRVLYLKTQDDHTFVILDAGMTELMRPALYEAHHEIVPLVEPSAAVQMQPVEVVGPVCETTDALAHHRPLPTLTPGDRVALLTAGAYGYVMANQYNARPRPAEVVISPDGDTWSIARRAETWDDLLSTDQL